jgi:hypothetical protein
LTLRENGGRKTSIRRRRLALIKKQQVGFEQKMFFLFVATKIKKFVSIIAKPHINDSKPNPVACTIKVLG